MTPLVSISCLTFNHAKYLRATLDGILLQKTNFVIEVVIHDDASTDGTVEIIRDYESKYPDLIFPVYQSTNQWSKGIKRIFSTFVYPKCRGQYIAFCEGDDFWTDPYKLQKQVDFLESNKDYGLIHTDYNILNDSTQKIVPSYHASSKKIISEGNILKALIIQNFIATVTVVARKNIIDQYVTSSIIKNIRKLTQGDYPLWLFIAGESKIGYINTATSTYRVLENSASHAVSKRKRVSFLLGEYHIKLLYLWKYRIKDFSVYWHLIKEFPNKLIDKIK